MKKIMLFMISLIIVLIPITVSAATENSEAKFGGTLNQCTSEYQDKNISTNGIAYMSYCMKAICQNNKYNVSYYYSTSELSKNNMIVKCTNGNSSPYIKLHKNGCTNYNSCSNLNEVKYCSTIWMYDCSKNSDGSQYGVTKPTQSKPPVTKVTKPKTTENTTEAIISTKLKSLTLSKGSINFNPDTYEYVLNLEEQDTFVEVTAVPEDSKAKVEVKNNTNLIDGSIIEIVVSSSNNSSTIYKITIKKEKIENVLSQNANLKSLNITGYDLLFNNKITDYNLVINEEDKKLNINYEVEDESATVKIENNENLIDGSKITIIVTAEDGTSKYYYINIIVKEKSNAISIIFIIILILALLAGAYYLYKKLVLSKSGDKYEYE